MSKFIRLYRKLAIIGGCLLASPVFAQCLMMPPEDFAALDFGTAERFDQGLALMLMQGMMGADDVALVPVGTVTLWALTVKDRVYIIREVESPHGPMLCSDDPVDRATFETGKLRTLPRSG